jgi:hypothetical protein
MLGTPKKGGRGRPVRLDGSTTSGRFPDHAGARDLHQWTIIRSNIMRVGAEVVHCTIIDDIGTPVRAEADVGRAVEPVDVGDKRLVAGAVAGKVLELQRER